MIHSNVVPSYNLSIENLSDMDSVPMKLQKILWKFHLDQGSENVLVWMVGYSVEQSMHFISSSGNLKQKKINSCATFWYEFAKKDVGLVD